MQKEAARSDPGGFFISATPAEHRIPGSQYRAM
jgi:hypothetical protein